MMNKSYEKINQIFEDGKALIGQGKVASYIPELSKVNPDQLGLYIISGEGYNIALGDYQTKFSMQSIIKVVLFICAIIERTSEEVLSKVTVEPTSSSFNSIVNLELKNANRPLNPFINAGAIVTVSLLKETDSTGKVNKVLELLKKMANNDDINYNEQVYLSEKATGSRNRALAYYMHSTGILEGDVEEILDTYFKLCSVEITCEDLANIAYVIAKDGYSEKRQEQLFEERIARIVRTVMALCGMYDASGIYAVEVGLPSKSGVGGGIMSVSLKRNGLGIGVFSPELDDKGNSLAGQYILEQLSKLFSLSIF